MAMKCPNCGEENPDGQEFCGHCGKSTGLVSHTVQPARPAYVPPSSQWLRSNWKVVSALVVVVLVVLLAIGIPTMPWSKIVVQVDNHLDGMRVVFLGVDNTPNEWSEGNNYRQEIGNSSNIDGEWTFHVTPGNHLLWMGANGVHQTWDGSPYFFTLVNVGPLSQKTVKLHISWSGIDMAS
jgi:hypothetical protein